MEDLLDLLTLARRGDDRALAKLITAVENAADGVLDLLDAVEVDESTHVLGVTGPPGSGKSTLVDRLVGRFRAQGRRVAVLLVDPSSPFTGGAVLGDRIRMQHHTGDDGVFIRSLGSRGHQGGLTRSTDQVLHLVRSAPFDQVIVETVGVGQTELQVMDLADTVLVVLVPEAGDAVQAMKAGLMEIAHLFAVNKSDRPGADRLVLELQQAVRGEGDGDIPVLAVSALQQEGLEALETAIASHRDHLRENPRAARSPRARLFSLLADGLVRRLAARIGRPPSSADLQSLLDAMETGAISPYRAAAMLLDDDRMLRDLLGVDEDSI